MNTKTAIVLTGFMTIAILAATMIPRLVYATNGNFSRCVAPFAPGHQEGSEKANRFNFLHPSDDSKINEDELKNINKKILETCEQCIFGIDWTKYK